MTEPLNIAVVGAGIGGLAAAGFLGQQGHKITVFDQFDKPAPVGSGLVVQPIGQRVLHALGVGDKARNLGAIIHKMEGVEASSGRKVLNITYDNSPSHNRFGLAMHRASLFECVHSAAMLAGAKIVPSTTVTRSTIRASQRRLASQNDNDLGAFDLVIDASGVTSNLSPLVSTPLSYGALWGVVDQPKDAVYTDILAQCYRKASTMVGILPIGKIPNDSTLKTAVFWSLPRDGYASWRGQNIEHWRETATTLWPAFKSYADQIETHDDLTMAQYNHGTLRNPVQDRQVFIGDAAHRTSPQLGQGANMALLDAMVLAECLARLPVNAALTEYALIRRWHVRIYQMMSRAFTPFYQSNSRILPFARDLFLAPVSELPIVRSVLRKLVSGEIAGAAQFKPAALSRKNAL